VRIKVELLNTEGSRKLTSIIQVFNTEHDVSLARNAFNNVSLCVDQVTSHVGWSTLLILIFSMFPAVWHNDVTFVITVPFTEYIINIEVSLVRIRNLDEHLRSSLKLSKVFLFEINFGIVYL